MKFLLKVGDRVEAFLMRPMVVAKWCLAVLAFSLLVDGSLFRLFSLHRDSLDLRGETGDLTRRMKELQLKLERASDPSVIEREALGRLELVGEGDLIFVFSDPD